MVTDLLTWNTWKTPLIAKNIFFTQAFDLCWGNLSSFYLSCLHLKLISVHIAARLRTTWALLFWCTWPAAADWTLLIDERSSLNRKGIDYIAEIQNEVLCYQIWYHFSSKFLVLVLVGSQKFIQYIRMEQGRFLFLRGIVVQRSNNILTNRIASKLM